MDWLDRWWVLPYLPESQGGLGRHTIRLSAGDRVEFVMGRRPGSIWVSGLTFPDPSLDKRLGEIKYLPPLALVFALTPLISLSLLVFAQSVASLMNGGAQWQPSALGVLIAGAATLPVLICLYWVYEWTRRHSYWVQTTTQGWLVAFWPPGLPVRARTPAGWMGETRPSSVWSGKRAPLSWIGAWITARFDVGNILIGSLAYGPFYDFLSWIRHPFTFQEIVIKLGERALRLEHYRTLVQRRIESAALDARVELATSDSRPSARQATPVEVSRRSAEALKRAFSEEFPGGETEVNLADYRRLFGSDATFSASSSYWNLENGEPL